MPVSINEQTLIFVSCIAAGILIGFVFDIFRIFRTVRRCGTIGTACGDIVFWIVALCILFATIYITGDGQMRWFVFLGAGGGFLLYLCAVSPTAAKWLLKIVRTTDGILRRCLRIVFVPFFKIFAVFADKCGKMKKIVKNAQRKSSENHKKRLAKLRRIGIILKKV